MNNRCSKTISRLLKKSPSDTLVKNLYYHCCAVTILHSTWTHTLLSFWVDFDPLKILIPSLGKGSWLPNLKRVQPKAKLLPRKEPNVTLNKCDSTHEESNEPKKSNHLLHISSRTLIENKVKHDSIHHIFFSSVRLHIALMRPIIAYFPYGKSLCFLSCRYDWMWSIISPYRKSLKMEWTCKTS